MKGFSKIDERFRKWIENVVRLISNWIFRSFSKRKILKLDFEQRPLPNYADIDWLWFYTARAVWLRLTADPACASSPHFNMRFCVHGCFFVIKFIYWKRKYKKHFINQGNYKNLVNNLRFYCVLFSFFVRFFFI